MCINYTNVSKFITDNTCIYALTFLTLTVIRIRNWQQKKVKT